MSLLLAILTVFPPAYALGLPSWKSDSPSLVSWFTWVRLFAELSYVPAPPAPPYNGLPSARRPRTPVERALVYPAVGAVIGCWAGAIPIGLDWERPWQVRACGPAFAIFISAFVLTLRRRHGR